MLYLGTAGEIESENRVNPEWVGEVSGLLDEVDAAQGLPQWLIVGLPVGAVKESRERVGAALVNSGFILPPRRITVNLAPADVRKEGSAFDLPIALGILVATGQPIRAENSDERAPKQLAADVAR